jgi:hypothetical protein
MVSEVFDDSAYAYLASIRASEMDQRRQFCLNECFSAAARLLKTRVGAPICKSMAEKEA